MWGDEFLSKKIKKDKKNTGIFSSKYNKAAIITVEIAALLTVAVLTCFVLTGKISLSSDNTGETYTLKNNSPGNSIEYKTAPSFAEKKNSSPLLSLPDGSQSFTLQSQIGGEQSADGVGSDILQDGNFSGGTSQQQSENGNLSGAGNAQSGNTSSLTGDPTKWSKSQILAKAEDAVAKTKSYKGSLSVGHKETFDADVTECTGGSLVASVANLLIGWVVSPVDETLSYNGGKAVNSEGETVPLILPKRGDFSLSESGVSTATASKKGNEYIIKLWLVKESVDLYGVPKYNSTAIGYLDVASMDISFMEVDKADITYKGSTIELHINSDGYVTYADYTIPLHVEGAAHKGSISGSAVFDGVQTEKWTLNW